MNKQLLEALESEVNAELAAVAKAEKFLHEPVTDGVVDIGRYLASSPKLLWILKEPWEDLQAGEAGGGWSVTQEIIGKEKYGNRGVFAPMAYVAYSVFNNFPPWSEIPYATKDAKVRDALKSIAYINVKKFPGKTTSYNADIQKYYDLFKLLLKRQINTINPDVVIGGRTLPMFSTDLGLKREEFTLEGSLAFCIKNRRLYIDAYHPAQWTQVKPADYVDEIVSVIKKHNPAAMLAIENSPS